MDTYKIIRKDWWKIYEHDDYRKARDFLQVPFERRVAARHTCMTAASSSMLIDMDDDVEMNCIQNMMQNMHISRSRKAQGSKIKAKEKKKTPVIRTVHGNMSCISRVQKAGQSKNPKNRTGLQRLKKLDMAMDCLRDLLVIAAPNNALDSLKFVAVDSMDCGPSTNLEFSKPAIFGAAYNFGSSDSMNLNSEDEEM